MYPCEISDELKRTILSLEPSRPRGPFPKNVNNRSFSEKYYFVLTKSNQKIERFWLCYSPTNDAVYCEPCWLFADRRDPNFKSAWCEAKINDWQGLTAKISLHENSKVHINACVNYSQRKNLHDIESQMSILMDRWQEILKRILDVIVTLARCNVALRGHRENYTVIDSQSGNFLNIIDLLSRYDPLLSSHLENKNSKIKYLSPKIQNELISTAEKHVINQITDEIAKAAFFSIIVDTTQDISKTDQLSFIIRYVSANFDKNVCIKESFLGFVAVKKHSAADLQNEVIEFLSKHNIPIHKCRGQGYDGAAVMSGEYSGLQSRIKKMSPNAEFVHCSSHNLNLVLQDSVKTIPELSKFYMQVNHVYVFFSESLPRWDDLNDDIAQNSNCIVKKTLKRMCPTRWSSQNDSVNALKYNFSSVMNCLSKIILISKKKHEIEEAANIQKNMNSFEFVLLLVFQSKVLSYINLASKTLQSPDITLEEACDLLESVSCNMMALRNDFSSLLQEAEVVAKSWQIDISFVQSRQRKVKRFYDELSEDFRFNEPSEKFRITVFNASLDVQISQLKTRFASMRKIKDNFSFLNPSTLIDSSEREIEKSARQLCDKYENDLSNCLIEEIASLKCTVSKVITSRNLKTISDLAQFLFIDYKILASNLPNVCTALILYLTLPVTSASAERSFSKLKLIKTYLRSTMSQSRLSGLATLSIEHELASKLDLDKVIKEFASAKNRRGLLAS